MHNRAVTGFRIGLLGCLILACATPAARDPEPLRVGSSGDYAPFSLETGGELSGFDVEVARAFAADRGQAVAWQTFRWPELTADLEAGRFDVVMSGVTVRPERSVAGRFSLPVTTSGAVALVEADSSWRRAEDLDAPDVAIAVNQGGHLERVTRASFPRARVIPIDGNQMVPKRLLGGKVDAVVTDTFEAPHWLRIRSAPALRVLGPFTLDTKAYWLPAESEALARDLDLWLGERERDGALAAIRARTLGSDVLPPTATPLPALIAAIDERLALMPFVAEVKRQTGAAIEVPAVEARVIAAAIRSVDQAADASDSPAPDPESVERLFRALIEAAKSMQHEQLSRPPDPSLGGFDLAGELRPALIRIGDRIARIVVRLHGVGGDAALEENVRALCSRRLEARGLGESSVAAIARAIAAIASESAR